LYNFLEIAFIMPRVHFIENEKNDRNSNHSHIPSYRRAKRPIQPVPSNNDEIADVIIQSIKTGENVNEVKKSVAFNKESKRSFFKKNPTNQIKQRDR